MSWAALLCVARRSGDNCVIVSLLGLQTLAIWALVLREVDDLASASVGLFPVGATTGSYIAIEKTRPRASVFHGSCQL